MSVPANSMKSTGMAVKMLKKDVGMRWLDLPMASRPGKAARPAAGITRLDWSANPRFRQRPARPHPLRHSLCGAGSGLRVVGYHQTACTLHIEPQPRRRAREAEH